MSAATIRHKFKKLKQKYVLLRTVEFVFLSAGVWILTFTCGSWLFPTQKMVISFLLALMAFGYLLVRTGLHRLNSLLLAYFLNRTYPQLKDSADLLLAENELTRLQQLQLEKVSEQFSLLYPSVKLPHHIFRSFGLFVFCLLVYFISSTFTYEIHKKDSTANQKTVRTLDHTDSVFVKSISVQITPPAYTGLKSFVSKTFDLVVPEGSIVKWFIEFSGGVSGAKIFFSDKDSIPLQGQTTQKNIFQSGFYELRWRDKNKIHRSEYFKIEVIKDHPPQISIVNENQFVRKIEYKEMSSIPLSATLTDDYGLANTTIVATVSKGSGEGVKFRDEKLLFSSPNKIEGKQIKATRLLDLKKMGLDPGDELYFYVEAYDNKKPIANRSRTETIFIAVKDTATEIISFDSGLGVDLMPEYFRSQRQIIIDTEKLIRDKKKISKQEFNSTSNQLGYDQKVLRVRYGEFLGMEDEAGIGESAEQHDENENAIEKYSHQHDTKNEANLVPAQKAPQDEKEHNHGDNKDPLKAFTHEHGDAEEATFFQQSIKAKLKAAVGIMWDAELYLRIYQPEKSLPYQYRALRLLKEISNDSRVYVHRMGFEVPPIKEDKRLSGDLSEIRNATNKSKNLAENNFSAVRAALPIIDRLLQKQLITLSLSEQTILHRAGDELAVVAINNPVAFLKALSGLKSVTEQTLDADALSKTLELIRKAFWKVLPPDFPSPSQKESARHPLEQNFLQLLKND
ncbi:MAG: hypothetical protein JST48_11180 [Bacteroidetes bacterium]|nr:hypothetical protein [Bacteroidota bacterium]